MARIDKELDVVTFIRKQMKLSVILETIFNKDERLQISQGSRFRLDYDVSEDSDDLESNSPKSELS